MCKPMKQTRQATTVGCLMQVAMILLAVPVLFGGAHGGIQSGKGVSIGPANRPAEKSGCAWLFIPLLAGGFALISGLINTLA